MNRSRVGLSLETESAAPAIGNGHCCGVNRAWAGLPLLALIGCHASGTWVDDAKNWKRAFGVEPGSGVKLERSWYWRSSHMTYEEAYYLAFAAGEETAEQLIGENEMQPWEGDAEEALRSKTCFERPEWFARPGEEAYDVWVNRSSIFLKGRTSGKYFLGVCQL